MIARRTPARRTRRSERPGLLGRGVQALARRPVSALGSVSGVAMIAMISVNALMLQSGPHPAPLFAPPPALTALGAGAAGPSDGAPAGDGLVRDVQTALADLGYYDGPIDGLDGAATAAAISAFEAAHGVVPTGVASEALLARALISSPRDVAPATTTAPPAPPAKQVTTTTVGSGGVPTTAAAPEASEEVRRVQKALADLGYGPLTIDGLAGGKTTTAVRRFRLDHGLPVSGDIDAALVETLVRIGGLPPGGAG